ncbi:hypothetical protein TPHA_0C01760 [Tetrapisispora phaffii CBS 4417]|uniref:C2H2-type domain-containing protein n=1 Tax=Tetrapisispora phaffii (strain ATCC 24235 / CBS 4417 / NBRC 1672 / NRRL Y-8282 / UCD 70-5) TaxID=1071381 RepID=G8BRF6_TETPH|nr:hypothetical protein TPHA_0C01760 [Tetrapisispora phaffii CBS 4417]CCE62332.1 hypothetical protein TPHA_0C01760 [Tetrapisispora phaffii CBS 4417]
MSVNDTGRKDANLFYKNAIEAINFIREKPEDELDPVIKEIYKRVEIQNDKLQSIQEQPSSTSNSIASHSNISRSNSIDGKNNKGNVDNTINNMVICAKCGITFKRVSELKRHEKSHLPILSNICSQCGKGFARKDALKRHYNTLTCKRNRSKLLYLGSEITELLNLGKNIS